MLYLANDRKRKQRGDGLRWDQLRSLVPTSQENNWSDTGSKNEWCCMSCQLTLEFNLGHCQFNLGMRKSGSALSENQRNHQRTFHKYRSAACIVCGHNACFSCFRFATEGGVTQSQSTVWVMSHSPLQLSFLIAAGSFLLCRILFFSF